MAHSLGIDEVEADVLPEQKSAIEARLKSQAGLLLWPETGSTMFRP